MSIGRYRIAIGAFVAVKVSFHHVVDAAGQDASLAAPKASKLQPPHRQSRLRADDA